MPIRSRGAKYEVYFEYETHEEAANFICLFGAAFKLRTSVEKLLPAAEALLSPHLADKFDKRFLEKLKIEIKKAQEILFITNRT